jgi:hypothetical protein
LRAKVGEYAGEGKTRVLAELAEAQHSGGSEDAARRVIRSAADIGKLERFPTWKVAANVLSMEARWENSGDSNLTCLIGKLDPSRHFEFSKDVAEMIPAVAKNGFNEVTSHLIQLAEKHIRAIRDEKGKWNAHAEMTLALARAAIVQPDLKSVARNWHDRLDEDIKKRSASARVSGRTQRLFRPQKLRHAQAMLLALEDDFPQALRIQAEFAFLNRVPMRCATLPFLPVASLHCATAPLRHCATAPLRELADARDLSSP